MTKKRITITLDLDIVEKLQELREMNAINISGFINRAIIEYLKGVF